jgi:hypothetical protein
MNIRASDRWRSQRGVDGRVKPRISVRGQDGKGVRGESEAVNPQPSL